MHFTDQWVTLGVNRSKPCWRSTVLLGSLFYCNTFAFALRLCSRRIPCFCRVSWMTERAGVSDVHWKSSTCTLAPELLLHIPFSRGLGFVLTKGRRFFGLFASRYDFYYGLDIDSLQTNLGWKSELFECLASVTWDKIGTSKMKYLPPSENSFLFDALVCKPLNPRNYNIIPSLFWNVFWTFPWPTEPFHTKATTGF